MLSFNVSFSKQQVRDRSMHSATGKSYIFAGLLAVCSPASCPMRNRRNAVWFPFNVVFNRYHSGLQRYVVVERLSKYLPITRRKAVVSRQRPKGVVPTVGDLRVGPVGCRPKMKNTKLDQEQRRFYVVIFFRNLVNYCNLTCDIKTLLTRSTVIY